MKAATSLMKRGLIAHSTDTVATTAVTIAGIAATSENSATNRLCRRAPARAARRAARSRMSSIAIRTIRTMTTRPSPTSSIKTTVSVGRIGVKPGENEEGREREDESRPDRDRPKPGRRSAVVERRRPLPARTLCYRPSRSRIPPPPLTFPYARRFVAIVQQCCQIATIWRRCQRKVGMSRRLRSRIFLRSVLRLRPRISAALI